MAFIKYDADNSATRYNSKPTIRFASNGLISFNYAAQEAMGLKVGDTIALFQDEDEPKEWCVARDKNGVKLREKPDSRGLLCNANVWHRRITEAVGIDEDKGVVFRVCATPDVVVSADKKAAKGWAIITASAVLLETKKRK